MTFIELIIHIAERFVNTLREEHVEDTMSFNFASCGDNKVVGGTGLEPVTSCV
jgi:hypothetical protein